MVSKASDDFPDPLTPVTMTSLPTGSVKSMFFRLCVRAPRTTRSAASPARWVSVSGMLGVRPYAEIYEGELNHHRSAGSYPWQPESRRAAERLSEQHPSQARPGGSSRAERAARSTLLY